MKIYLSPQIREDKLEIFKEGDKLIVNGLPFDFSSLPEGAVLKSSAIDSIYFVGDVVRVDGELELTLLYPIRQDSPSEAKFPEPVINPSDGKINLLGGVK